MIKIKDLSESNYFSKLQQFNPKKALYNQLIQWEIPIKEIDQYYLFKSKQIDSKENRLELETLINQFIKMKVQGKACQICMQIVFFQTKLKCSHVFCRSCIINYLINRIILKKVDKVKCLNEECEYIFSPQQIKEYLQETYYKKYHKILNQQELSQNPNLRWCTKNNCNGYAIKNGSSDQIICECGQKICFKCGQAWHLESCDQNIKQQYGKIIQDLNLQKCPKCGLFVQKVSGCNHMRCTKCEYQFCWLCLRIYTQNHYKWWNVLGCPKQINSQFYWKGWKYLFFIFCVPILLILISSFLIISLLIGVIGGFAGPLIFLRKYLRNKQVYTRRKLIIIWILGIILTIVLYPVSVVVAIFPGSCYYFHRFARIYIYDNL